MSEDLNERIARALGDRAHAWRRYGADAWQCKACAISAFGYGEPPKSVCTYCPDYAGSVDACLPVLADHPEWAWSLRRSVYRAGKYYAAIEWPARDKAFPGGPADSPAAALAECIALALEAERV